MAILNGLTKETSFRRFYLRWLAACWLPVVGVVAIWSSGWVFGVMNMFVWLRIAKPFELWLLVGIGQWLFLRPYTGSAGRWAMASGIGGVIATIVWASTTPYVFVNMIGLMPRIGVYALPALGLPYGSPIVAVAGGVISGLAIALLQSPFLSPTWRHRGVWLFAGAVLGGAIYGLLIPLQEVLDEVERTIRLGHFSSLTMLVIMAAAMMMPTYMMANWVLYSAGTGILLWGLRRREMDRQRSAIRETFE